MGLLEVIALHTADAQRTKEGGTDRIEPPGTMNEDGFSPESAMVTKVCRATSIQVHPMMWLRAGFHTDGGELVRLRGLIASYLNEGADGVVLGFLDGHAGIDLEVCNALVADGDLAWTFHRAVDNCLDFNDAWGDLAALLRFDQVFTTSSTHRVRHGLDKLLERARSNPGIARMIMTGGGLRPERVPWLIRIGVRVFRIGSPTHPGGSYKTYVDLDLMCTWRELIGEQTAAIRRSR